MMIISIVIILIYSKKTVFYCLDLISRDSLYNYIIDRKTLINTILCVQTNYTFFIDVTNKTHTSNGFHL